MFALAKNLYFGDNTIIERLIYFDGLERNMNIHICI